MSVSESSSTAAAKAEHPAMAAYRQFSKPRDANHPPSIPTSSTTQQPHDYPPPSQQQQQSKQKGAKNQQQKMPPQQNQQQQQQQQQHMSAQMQSHLPPPPTLHGGGSGGLFSGGMPPLSSPFNNMANIVAQRLQLPHHQHQALPLGASPSYPYLPQQQQQHQGGGGLSGSGYTANDGSVGYASLTSHNSSGGGGGNFSSINNNSAAHSINSNSSNRYISHSSQSTGGGGCPNCAHCGGAGGQRQQQQPSVVMIPVQQQLQPHPAPQIILLQQAPSPQLMVAPVLPQGTMQLQQQHQQQQPILGLAAQERATAPSVPASTEKETQNTSSQGKGGNSTTPGQTGTSTSTATPHLHKKPAMVQQAKHVPKLDPSDKGPKQLIVNYLPSELREKELFQLFEQFGPLQCVKIMTNPETGLTRGFGFVYFASSSDAAKAMNELQGFEMYGKYLRVGYAVPQRAPNEGWIASRGGGGALEQQSDRKQE